MFGQRTQTNGDGRNFASCFAVFAGGRAGYPSRILVVFNEGIRRNAFDVLLKLYSDILR